ncbi:VOC family protein [Acidiferrimicrobium sp. IK]|uniref:VOC family protein n=1 Tax=Acidiferrimicrobium sp. IK TaxID=2871700 RepID=UPI0021CB5BAB|nr:VOC family protein [Acidiferrimicrobium sp. IK]MCU4182784.1 VOC family protein [Acidiferrimicrobium sp. IK]
MATLRSLDVADRPDVWEAMGFAVAGGVCWVSDAAIRLGGSGAGITGWTIDGAPDLIELPVGEDPDPGGAAPPGGPGGSLPAHPNGVIALDHVVVSTPDLDRTVQAFEAAGVALRRIRELGPAERPRAQAFFKLGDIVIEVVGALRDSRPGPAGFYGLAFTVSDLDATGRYLGSALRPAKDAVQAGRRIATLDPGAGSTVAIAFMSATSG